VFGFSTQEIENEAIRSNFRFQLPNSSSRTGTILDNVLGAKDTKYEDPSTDEYTVASIRTLSLDSLMQYCTLLL
jgi:hypothetical protein